MTSLVGPSPGYMPRSEPRTRSGPSTAVNWPDIDHLCLSDPQRTVTQAERVFTARLKLNDKSNIERELAPADSDLFQARQLVSPLSGIFHSWVELLPSDSEASDVPFLHPSCMLPAGLHVTDLSKCIDDLYARNKQLQMETVLEQADEAMRRAGN